MNKNIFRTAPPPSGSLASKNFSDEVAKTVAALKGFLPITAGEWIKQLVGCILSLTDAAIGVQNPPQSRSRSVSIESDRTPAQASHCISGGALGTEALSARRSYYASFYDRDQLARAINVNGDWDDQDIADLVRRGASSPTADGHRLRCMLDDEIKPEPPKAFPKLVAARLPALVSTPSTALSRPSNPFGSSRASHDAVVLTTADDGTAMIYDPFKMVWIVASPTSTAVGANPFSTQG